MPSAGPFTHTLACPLQTQRRQDLAHAVRTFAGLWLKATEIASWEAKFVTETHHSGIPQSLHRLGRASIRRFRSSTLASVQRANTTDTLLPSATPQQESAFTLIYPILLSTFSWPSTNFSGHSLSSIPSPSTWGRAPPAWHHQHGTTPLPSFLIPGLQHQTPGPPIRSLPYVPPLFHIHHHLSPLGFPA